MTNKNPIDQLVVVTVLGAQADTLTKHLNREGFYVTRIDSSGGILDEVTTSMLIGLAKARLDHLLGILRECCHARRRYIPVHVEAPLLEVQPAVIEAEVGGALIYVLDVERFEQL